MKGRGKEGGRETERERGSEKDSGLRNGKEKEDVGKEEEVEERGRLTHQKEKN